MRKVPAVNYHKTAQLKIAWKWETLKIAKFKLSTPKASWKRKKYVQLYANGLQNSAGEWENSVVVLVSEQQKWDLFAFVYITLNWLLKTFKLHILISKHTFHHLNKLAA